MLPEISMPPSPPAKSARAIMLGNARNSHSIMVGVVLRISASDLPASAANGPNRFGQEIRMFFPVLNHGFWFLNFLLANPHTLMMPPNHTAPYHHLIYMLDV